MAFGEHFKTNIGRQNSREKCPKACNVRSGYWRAENDLVTGIKMYWFFFLFEVQNKYRNIIYLGPWHKICKFNFIEKMEQLQRVSKTSIKIIS